MNEFQLKLQQRSREIDAELAKASNVAPEVPEDMVVTDTNVYAVFKRSNMGSNKRVLMNLPMSEAIYWAVASNRIEKVKRDRMSSIPDEVFFYDCVKQESEQENVYWNSKELTKEELEIDKSNVLDVEWKG